MELVFIIGYVFNLCWIFVKKVIYALMILLIFLFRIVFDRLKEVK